MKKYLLILVFLLAPQFALAQELFGVVRRESYRRRTGDVFAMDAVPFIVAEEGNWTRSDVYKFDRRC